MTPARLVQAADLNTVRASLRDAPWIAVDTEFHTERTYLPELFLVQVALPNGDAWLIDPLQPELLRSLADDIVAVPAWIVHAGEQDLRVLSAALGAVPATILDTQIAAGLVGEQWPAGLASLLRTCLRVEVDKSATLTDWSKRPLRPEQLRYAASDVLWLGRLWDRLYERAAELGRLPILRAACAEARTLALSPQPDAEVWRALLGAHQIDSEEAAIVRELAAWREHLGREMNKPPRALLPDPALRQLARLRPTSLDQLAHQRKLNTGFLRQHGAAVLRAVATGLAVPPAERPRPVRPGTTAARLAQGQELLGDIVGRERQFARPLVLPPLAVYSLATQPPERRADVTRALGSWRDALLGDSLAAWWDGSLTLRLTAGDIRLIS